jgi:7-cyano-7-deazaguanine synthase
MARPAVVLLSGGLDSTTVLAIARDQGFTVTALSFDYNQRHRVELEAAHRVAATAGVDRHVVLPIGLDRIGGSALTDPDMAVPTGRRADALGDDIPDTYVPARNTIFLACALGLAETVGASDVFLGVNALDYSGYPDCRPEFIRAFEDLAQVATAAAVQGRQALRVHAPLIAMTKAEIIQAGTALGVDYALTTSCYQATADGACGVCDSCVLRLKGFADAGLVDPAPYRSTS